MHEPKTPVRPEHRRKVLIGLAAALVGGGALTLFGRDGEAAPPPPPAAGARAALTVELIAPSPQTLARTVAASGSVAARDELLIGADAAGVRLTQVLVEVGARVQAGQLLARGDDAPLQAQLAQLKAQVKQAEAERLQADANLERAERIADSGIYSVEAVQTRRTAALAAAARLELAQAQQQETELRIAMTRVRAPAAGVVSRRSASVGLVMNPGTELFRLMRDGQVEWLAELPEHALAQVQPGATARVTLADGRSVEGRVRLVEPTLDARSRNGLVHVVLPADAGVKAGGHAKGEIVVAEARVPTLPEAVVFQRDGSSFVVLVDGSGKARYARVATGVRRGGLVEVSGLPADARVVATGAGFVKDGETVRVAPLPTVMSLRASRAGASS